MFEQVLPGECLILYAEDNSYVYARNDGNGLIIERAFVPDTQVKRESREEYNRRDEEQLKRVAKEIGAKLKARDGNKDLSPADMFMLFSCV